MQDTAELRIETRRVVSRHLLSDPYLGHIFLSDIPAPSAIHGNLRRSKVVENIAVADYTPISALKITPCHSKIRRVMLPPDREGRYKAPSGRAGCKTTNLASL